mgnify:CR=1 FL=1
MKKFFALSALVLVSMTSAYADDARSLYDQAVSNYAARADLSRNDSVISTLERAKTLTEDTDLKYSIVVLLSRAYYWKGMNSQSNDARKQHFEAALDAANDAKRITDDYAEAYYYAAISRGRWAEANGVLASLRYAGELMDNCKAAKERITVEGESGETVDSFGPARTLGRVYAKLPGFAGGSTEKARQNLEVAFANGRANALNHVYLAEVLNGGSSADKARARQMLDALLATPPEQLNADRLPEMVEEYRLARELRNSMGR